MPYDIHHIQTLLVAGNYMPGPVNRATDVATDLAVAPILARNKTRLNFKLGDVSVERMRVAAAQLILDAAGYKVGVIDGYWGNQTEGAWLEWSHEHIFGTKLSLPKTPPKDYVSPKSKFPKQKDCAAFYGKPLSTQLESQLVYIEPPFRMVLEWDRQSVVSRIRIHQKCSKEALAALEKIGRIYGQPEIDRLGFHLFAGSYVPRPMRGSKSTWSMHAYGCALDFNSGKNGLTTRAPQASFSHPDCKEYFDIWESVGFVSLGRAIGRDWMHVQAATLN